MKKKVFITIISLLLFLLILIFLIKFYKINKIINLMKTNTQDLDNYSYEFNNTYIKRNGNIVI